MSKTWLAGGLACAGLMALGGCGTGEYNRQAAATLHDMLAETRFKVLFAPTQLPGTPIKVRVPLVFQRSYQEDTKHPNDGGQISPDRVQPPFLKLPGFKVCYESLISDPNNGKIPYYCYLAAVPAKPGDIDGICSDLQTKLKETFKDTPEAWEVIDCDSPSGFPVQWKKLHVVGEQPFRVFKDNKVEVVNLPGTFELWAHDAKQYVVLIAWRSPTAAEGASAPPPKTDSSNPLLQLQQRDTESKLDIVKLPALTAGTITSDESPAGP